VQDLALSGIYRGAMTPAFALRRKPDAAFETLYRRHVHEIYRYSLALLGNPSDAEDVTQTTFLNAYRAIQGGERPRKPGAWLRTIAHNVCKQRFRQAARRPSEVIVELDELRGSEEHEEPEGPSAADIKRALESLPFNQRSAIVMRELEGRRQSDIAETLGLSESAVEALLFRGRRAMREQLEASITCGEAERAVSRQLDRSLPRAERGRLRAHLRECDECASFARQARAQRGALKSLGAAVPLPASLLSWGGGGSSVVGAAVGLKVAAGVAAVAVAVGVGDLGIHYLGSGHGDHGRPAAGAGEPAARAASSSAASGSANGAQGARPGLAGPGAGHPAKRAAHGRRGAASQHRGGRPARGGNGSPAPPNGDGVHGHGQQGSGGGNGTRAHGTPTPGHGNGSNGNGTPTRAHGTPARGHSGSGQGRYSGTPSRGQGAPSRGQGQSPNEHAAPPASAHEGKPEPPPKKADDGSGA
jgi:RNA polymerase sigma factor (sigma-70 family)